MVKTHNVRMLITNNTGLDMKHQSDFYDSGRPADTYSWPSIISGHEGTCDVLSYERDNSWAGCSGYVTYSIGGTNVTFGFSNPAVGTNKLGVGTDGKGVYDKMENHDYNTFDVFITLGNGQTIKCACQCTGGDTNQCTVNMVKQ